MSIVDRILRIGEGRTLKKLDAIADQVEALADEYSELSDAELREMTDDLKERYQDGETLDDLLPEAFATVVEAADRGPEAGLATAGCSTPRGLPRRRR